MSQVNLRVVKLGGSLLDLPDIAPRLRAWLEKHPALINLIVVGGGEMIEEIRRLDFIHQFQASFTHWLCIDMLDHSAQIICQLFPEFDCISTHDELQTALQHRKERNGCQVVKVKAFYSRQHSDVLLPESWSTTSDTLAALLAHRVQAEELCLLKSVSPVSGCDSLEAWAKMGLVDQAFPQLASGIPKVTLENLRCDA